MLFFVIVFILVIIYPLITSFVYISTSFFGQPVSYLVGGLVANLYVPLLAVLVVMGCLITVKFFCLNLFINTKLLGVEVTMPKFRFMEVLVILICIVAAISIVFKSLVAEWNLVQDISHLTNSNFAVMDGVARLYTVSHDLTEETKMQINGIKMEGGLVSGEELVEGATYHVEYLPHSKYVVNYHLISR